MKRGFLAAIGALLLAGSAQAASTINGLPPITPYPLIDPGCNSTENLWISRGNGAGSDFRITPTQLGYAYQGITAPACPYRYQFWWNTSVNPPQYSVYDGLKWLVVGALDPIGHVWSLPSPILSGTVTGTYTLGGTVTIVSPAISDPVLSGFATGTYTLGGTSTILKPALFNPTVTGTISGFNILPLAGLAQISGNTILGNSTAGFANVGPAYTTSGSGTVVTTTIGAFTAGDLLVAGDIHGSVESSTTYGQAWFRALSSGATTSLNIQNNASAAGTQAQLSLQTASGSGVLFLRDDPSAANRQLALQISSGIQKGMLLDSSGGGANAVLSLIGGSAADGITLSGTPEVLYAQITAGSTTQLRVFNNASSGGTIASLMAQTGTGGATAALQAQDGATPAAVVVAGSGMTGGLSLKANNGPITLAPISAAIPQAVITTTNAGTESRFSIVNTSSAAGTTASLHAATGTSGAFALLQMVDGATPVGKLTTGIGATGGLQIQTSTGPLYLQPAVTTPIAAPQAIVQINNASGIGGLQVLNNSTGGGTVSELVIQTGTANSYLSTQVAETGHAAKLITGAGLTSGLQIDTTTSGSAATLALISGGDISLTPLALSFLKIVNLPTVAAGTAKDFLCIDFATSKVYAGTGASCN